MNTRKVRGKQAVEGLFNGHSSLLNFGQNKKKKNFFFSSKSNSMVWAVWDTWRAVWTKPPLSHVCGSPEGPLLCLNEIHWFWSLHREAELYLLAVYLSQYRPNTTQPLQLFAMLTPDAPVQSGCHWKRQIEFYGCICSTSSSQCIILSLQKKHLYQKKKKRERKNNNNRKLWHLPKASGMSYDRVPQGQLSSDASQSGDFQDALKCTFLFHFIDYSWVKNN